MPPPRFLRPPNIPPPSVPPPGMLIQPSGTGSAASTIATIPKQAQKLTEEEQKSAATIEAKPQIKHIKGDVTRFTPTAIKIKRELKDSKGRLIKPAGKIIVNY